MKTDTVYYKVFSQSPQLAFELLGYPFTPSYTFNALEVKAFGFRFDGILEPPANSPHLPIIFLEVQSQPDPVFYHRLHSEIALYLYKKNPPNPIQTLVLYPSPSVERLVVHSEAIFQFCNLRRVYLNELEAGASLDQDVLRLLVAVETVSVKEAKVLIQQVRQVSDLVVQTKYLDLITEILNRKFPNASNTEIKKMLDLAPLEQTKAYQEGLQNGWQEGRQEGLQDGRQEGRQEGWQEGQRQIALNMLRFGMAIAQIVQITGLSEDQVKALQNGQ